jgi:hypothetical protein
MSTVVQLDQLQIRELVKKNMEDKEFYKRNPGAIQRLSLDLLRLASAGEVDLVDPTNPFVFLLEMSALNSSLTINELYITLRRQYPELSRFEDELYLHMSDKEHINISSVPARAKFTFAVAVNDVRFNEEYDPTDRSFKLIIPRGSKVNVDDTPFLLLYPIVIRRYENGFVQVSQDADVESLIEPLVDSILDYEIVVDSSQTEWMFFNVDMPQLRHVSHITTIDDMTTYRVRVPYEDIYHWAEVYYRPTGSQNWTRIKTVMNEVHYDYYNTTAVLKIYGQELEVLIPNFYQIASGLSGEVKIDIYSTKGHVTMDMRMYPMSMFGLQFSYFDQKRDLSVFSTRMQAAQHYVFSKEIIDDGRSALSFTDLRDRVIDSSLGSNIKKPVSHIQLKNNFTDNSFELVNHSDDITKKTILTVRRLPKADNPKYIAEMNAGIYSMVFKLSDIVDNERVRNHPSEDSFTILSDSVFVENNGVLSLLYPAEVERIKTLPARDFVDEVNSKQYVFNPFYYVVDKVEDFDAVRVYELDLPETGNRSVMRQNHSLSMVVQTSSPVVEKIPEGYRFTFRTKSGQNFRSLTSSDVRCQVAFPYRDSTELLYINADLVSILPDQERVFSFVLETNYFIDSDDFMHSDSLTPYNETSPRGAVIPLTGKVRIIYLTSEFDGSYTRTDIEDVINYGIVPTSFVGISMETMEYKLGTPVRNIYRRLRNFADAENFQRYSEDVYMTYKEDIYAKNAETGAEITVGEDGELIRTLLHAKGEIVLDSEGKPIPLHKKGDPVLDEEGNLVLLPFDELQKELAIYYLEGHYYFLNRPSVANYVKKIKRVVTEWSSIDLERLKDTTLEVNNLYYYPKTSLGVIQALDEYNTICQVRAAQSLKLRVWLYRDYFYDSDIKDTISTFIKTYLTEVITNEEINNNDVIKAIKDRFPAQIHLVTMNGLGGDLDRLSFRMADYKESFCIGKKYHIEDDGTIDIREDIDIHYLVVN